MELEKPQPEQVVTDLETVSQTPLEAMNHDQYAANQDKTADSEDLRPGTIQACYRPGPQPRNRQSQPRKKQYVI